MHIKYDYQILLQQSYAVCKNTWEISYINCKVIDETISIFWQ